MKTKTIVNYAVTPQQFFLYKDNSGRVQINALFRNLDMIIAVGYRVTSLQTS
jgi:hypothetical protein